MMDLSGRIVYESVGGFAIGQQVVVTVGPPSDRRRVVGTIRSFDVYASGEAEAFVVFDDGTKPKQRRLSQLEVK